MSKGEAPRSAPWDSLAGLPQRETAPRIRKRGYRQTLGECLALTPSLHDFDVPVFAQYNRTDPSVNAAVNANGPRRLGRTRRLIR